MILSVSRRTDIPALYSDWFLNRLRAGEVLVRNPMNSRQVSRIPLSPGNIDCIVFWTKDPRNLMDHLDEIDRMGYRYYFTITVNSYDQSIESPIPKKGEIIKSLKILSDRIGRERIIWRYDPVIFTKSIDSAYHLKWFEYLAGQLEGDVDKCVFSFLSEYNKIASLMRETGVRSPVESEKRHLVKTLALIAEKYSLKLSSCAQREDYEEFGVEHNSCIDRLLIEKITGTSLKVNRDKAQRPGCLCIESRDIGTYNTCTKGCIYCYANRGGTSDIKRLSVYDPDSPLLCDHLDGSEMVKEYSKSRSLRITDSQKDLFD